MAKITKDPAVKKTEPVVKPAKEKKAVTGIQKVYTVTRAAEDKDKLPPQAVVIVNALNGKAELTLERVTAELNLPETFAALKTKQPVERIFAFYRNRLIALGIINVTEIEVEKTKSVKKDETATPAEESTAEGSENPVGEEEKQEKPSFEEDI